MTSILTWNIQCGLGVDGQVDLNRISEIIKNFGDADIICLQEVARFEPELDNGVGADQFSELAALFPDHHPVYGPALDRWYNGDNQRRQFGNMVLSRLPIIQVFNHLLPQPTPPTPCKHMQRQALEVVVNLSDGPLRITTTHLEYHCEEQRLAQAEHLREIQSEVSSNSSYNLTAPDFGLYSAVARPERGIICGDFNALVDDDVYRLLTAGSKSNESSGYKPSVYKDAWRIKHEQRPHAPTCGIYDPEQWPEGPHCRDFIFLTRELSPLVKDVQVQEETNASDHQPVLMLLETD